MEIEIINIEKDRGEIYLKCRCVKPILEDPPWAGDIRPPSRNAEEIYERRHAMHKIAMSEFKKVIEQIHLGESELKL